MRPATALGPFTAEAVSNLPSGSDAVVDIVVWLT
jgi:hypothetical protein